MEYTNKTLQCVGCGQPFVWSATDQFLYAGRGLRHQPKRCGACRARRQAPRARPRTAVVCAGCGRETSVPFQPREGRPVYCDACYSLKRAAGPPPGSR
jgi:CxxC-x17-CxxC domain-containing protein